MILLVVLVALFFRWYLLNTLPLNELVTDNLFISSIFKVDIALPAQITVLIGLGNALLLYIIGKKIFSGRVALVTSILYSFSPWTAYLDISGSFYVFILFWLLVFYLGLIIFHEGQKRVGLVTIIISCLFLIYNSIFFIVIVPFLLISALKIGFLTSQGLKIIIICFLAFIPLFLFMAGNTQEMRSILQSEFSLFSDVGLLNAVNQFQGETKQSGFFAIGRIVENRYLYFPMHLFFNTLRHFSPATYFTSQEKMFGFSFSPPVFLGLIVPFLLGLQGWKKLFEKYSVWTLLILVLLLPSVMSGRSPDLMRLVLFSPIIFFTISYGLMDHLITLKTNVKRLFLFFVLLLVVFQGLVVFFDIGAHEPLRLQKLLDGR